MNDDLYGFQLGELVQFRRHPAQFGRISGRSSSAEGRLLVTVRVSGRAEVFIALPQDLKSLIREAE